jgi:hypothetical protein
MKKTDKLRHQRYEIEMKILQLELKQKREKLSKNELSELGILRQKESELEQRIKEAAKE